MFGSLYFLEGQELQIILFIVPMYLIDKGVPLPILTLVSGIAGIPWLTKFVWGGIVDYFIRYGRKRFIILGGMLTVLSFVALSFIDPDVALVPFVLFLFLSHCGIVFLDVSADAWAIEISSEKDRGKINGAMMTGLLIGGAVGALLFPHIVKISDYNIVFLVAGFIVLITIIYPFITKEIKKVRRHKKVTLLVLDEFKKKTVLLIAIFGIVLAISVGLHYTVGLFERIVLHMDIVQIGVLGAAGIFVSVPGALIGGILADRLGRKTTLLIFIGIRMIFSAALIFVTSWQLLAVIYAPIAFASPGFMSTLNALFMDVSNPRVGATQFSIFTSLSNLGEFAGGTMSGTLILLLDYGRVFLYSAWILGPALLVLYFIKLKPPIKKN